MEDIQDWIQKIMISSDPNWTRVPGLVDWLRNQPKEVRLRFHRRRIKEGSRHESPVNKLMNMGDILRVSEIKTSATLRIRTDKAKLLLIQNPKLYRLCKLWVGLEKTKMVDLRRSHQREIEKRIEGTGVNLRQLEALVKGH